MAPHYELHPDRNFSIAVAGGGIGGLCTAIGLLHQGVPVTIYEGQQYPTHLNPPDQADTVEQPPPPSPR